MKERGAGKGREARQGRLSIKTFPIISNLVSYSRFLYELTSFFNRLAVRWHSQPSSGFLSHDCAYGEAFLYFNLSFCLLDSYLISYSRFEEGLLAHETETPSSIYHFAFINAIVPFIEFGIVKHHHLQTWMLSPFQAIRVTFGGTLALQC